MGEDVKGGTIHLARPLRILCFQLFIQSIVDPQVDVTAPVSLLLRHNRRLFFLKDVGYSYYD